MKMLAYVCCAALFCLSQDVRAEDKTRPNQDYLPRPHFSLRKGESPDKAKDLALQGNVMNIAATKDNPLLFGDDQI